MSEPHVAATNARALNLAKLFTTYSLLIITAMLIIDLSLLLLRTLPTEFNVRSILGTQSVIALLALAVMIPLAAGQYDLSVGVVLGITEMTSVCLQIDQHLAWPAAVLLALCVGGFSGLANGVLFTVARIDSFIATLASGIFALGITNWYSNGQQIAGAFPDAFTDIANISFVGYVPLPGVIVALVAGIMYAVLEYLPVGRRLYALGSNPRMAELVGIPARQYVIFSFVSSGVLSGLAGVILGAQLQAGQPDIQACNSSARSSTSSIFSMVPRSRSLPGSQALPHAGETLGVVGRSWRAVGRERMRDGLEATSSVKDKKEEQCDRSGIFH